MKIQSILSILTVLITFYSCNQSKLQNNAFILKGKVIGPKTEYLILGYRDSSNVYVMDTRPLNNNSFSTQGHLIHTQIVSLSSN